ncbi:MAG: HAD family hydrolase [Acidimicrobiales bacterium]
MVATDLDGTLVRSDGTISDRTVAALELVVAAGAELIFVTGRPLAWLQDIADRTGHCGLAIVANGALVYDLEAEEVTAEYLIEADVTRALVEVLQQRWPELGFAVAYRWELAADAAFVAHSDVPLGLEVRDLDKLVGEPVVKLLARHPRLDPDTLLAQAAEIVGELATVTHSSRSGLVELSAAGVSKASTLASLCEDRGVAADEVVAFGDMPNDLLLLAWAGTGYAVANAHPEVRAAVPHLTASNDDDGVAQVLEELFG